MSQIFGPERVDTGPARFGIEDIIPQRHPDDTLPKYKYDCNNVIHIVYHSEFTDEIWITIKFTTHDAGPKFVPRILSQINTPMPLDTETSAQFSLADIEYIESSIKKIRLKRLLTDG